MNSLLIAVAAVEIVKYNPEVTLETEFLIKSYRDEKQVYFPKPSIMWLLLYYKPFAQAKSDPEL